MFLSIVKRIASSFNGSGKKSGKVIMLYTSKSSCGYADMVETLKEAELTSRRANVSVVEISINSKSFTSIGEALGRVKVDGEDIILIGRGGGDISHCTFNAFKSNHAAVALRQYRSKGAKIVTGVGHHGDNFAVDKAANYSECTPTAAANRVIKLLNGSESKSKFTFVGRG